MRIEEFMLVVAFEEADEFLEIFCRCGRKREVFARLILPVPELPVLLHELHTIPCKHPFQTSQPLFIKVSP